MTLNTDFTLIYPFHTHLEGLMAGLLLAWAGVRWPLLYQPSSGARPKARVLVGVAACILAAGGLHILTGKLFAWVVWGLLFGAITALALLDRSWITRWMRLRAWYPLSRLTYGMYLNHFWVLPWTSVVTIGLLRSVGATERVVFFGGLAVGAIISMAFATVTFLVIERPFLLLRDRHLAHRGARERRIPDRALQAD